MMAVKNNVQQQRMRRIGAWGRLLSDIVNFNGAAWERDGAVKKMREVRAIERHLPELRHEDIDRDFGRPGLRELIDTLTRRHTMKPKCTTCHDTKQCPCKGRNDDCQCGGTAICPACVR